MNSEREAIVFDIQPYSIHDGPGIRTTIFLKGCPLHCLWCHNPESNSEKPQLMYYSGKCKGCGRCILNCPKNAIEFGEKTVKTRRDLCINCGRCSESCPYGAREIKGQITAVENLLKKVLSDRMFFKSSGGGVTISGGEPLMQPNFVRSLVKACQDQGIHTAVETCGYASWKQVQWAFENVDLVLYDLKAIDSKLHEQCTGVPNEKILTNVQKLYHVLKKNLVIRIPVIPGFNDTNENISATADFVAQRLGKEVPVHLLPYHEMGNSKLDSMENTEKRLEIQPPSDSHMEEIKAWMEAYGLIVQIGGSM